MKDSSESEFLVLTSVFVSPIVIAPAAFISTHLAQNWALPVESPTLQIVGWVAIFLACAIVSLVALVAGVEGVGDITTETSETEAPQSPSLLEAQPQTAVGALLLGGAYFVSLLASLVKNMFVLFACFGIFVLCIGIFIALQTVVMTGLLLTASALAYALGTVASWIVLGGLTLLGLCFVGNLLRHARIS